MVLTFSEGSVATSTMNAVVSGGNNTKLDYVPASLVTTLLGDVDPNGVVDFFDIQPFIDVLLSGGTFQAEAVCNMSGGADFFDIQPFIDILLAP